MARVYRIRDTQRFIFLALLFPLMPLLLHLAEPPWTRVLFLLELLFIFFAFWMLLRPRELEIGDDEIRIDRGRLRQMLFHEEMYEIILLKQGGVVFRTKSKQRYVRLTAPDSNEAVRHLLHFAWRHDIPVHDRRPGRQFESAS